MSNDPERFQTLLFSSLLIWTTICLSGSADNVLDARNLPRFLDTVPNITKTVGRDALLTCNVEQLKGYKVAWVQVDTQTILTIHKQVITRNPRISLLHDDHRSWHLQIKNLQESDRGWYMCQVNTDPMRYIQGYLDVVVPPDIVDKESSGDLIVEEGKDVTLKCKAKGHPEPKIVWRRENNEDIVLETDKTDGGNDSGDDFSSPSHALGAFPSVREVEGEVLHMKGVSRLQMGSYLCIASNNVPPSISKRIHLKIHFAPVAWVPQQLEGAYVGQELTIECHTEAYPMSINYWTNNKGEMIVSGDRFESIVAKSSYKAYMKLRIKRVQKEDFGEFKCLAKNSLGETDGAIRIYEMEAPQTPAVNVNDYDPDKELENGVRSSSSAPSQYKKERNKLEDIRKGVNEITDPSQRAKGREKDFDPSREHHRRRPTNYFLGTPDTESGVPLMTHGSSNILIFIFLILKLFC